MNYILIGMPGSGKSTFGKILAEKYNLFFLDFDEYLEIETQTSVGILLKKLGEEKFLELESFYGKNINFENTIFSTSGSLPYSKIAMLHLKKLGNIVYLKVPKKDIITRFYIMKTERIIGFGEKTFDEIYEERESIYLNYADIIFEYTGNNIRTITLDLEKALGLTL